MSDAATKGPGFQAIPGIKVKPPPVSLLSVATNLSGQLGNPGVGGGPAWKSGVAWRSAACAPGYRWSYCGYNDSTVKQDPADINAPGFLPYTIYVPYRCDWVTTERQPTTEGGSIGASDYRQDANDELEAVTPFHVSQELWTGSIEADNPSLENSAVDVTGSGAVHPVTALGTLMDAWASGSADHNSQGGGIPVIHAPWSIVVSLIANHIISQQGDAYYGPGCYVSPGPGYPTDGSGGPNGDDAGEGNVWMYLSGPVEYALGDPEEIPDDESAHWDRRANAWQVWAQRQAIHRFDPCSVFAVETYVPSPAAGEIA